MQNAIAKVVGWMRPTDGDVISAARRQDMLTSHGTPGKRVAEEYSVGLSAGQADGRALLVALETIASWPVAEQDNMQAANMRKLAQDALRGRTAQPLSKHDEWAAMLALSEQPEIAALLEAFSHDSTEDNAVYLVRGVVHAVGAQASKAWIDPVALASVSPQYDKGFADGVSESKRLNAQTGGDAVEQQQ